MKKTNIISGGQAPSKIYSLRRKLFGNKKITALILLGALLLVAGAVVYILNDGSFKKRSLEKNVDRTNCANSRREINDLITTNKAQEAKDKLAQVEDKCGQLPNEAYLKDKDQTGNSVALIQYNTEKAKTEWALGNKEDAKKIAQETLDTISKLSTDQYKQLSGSAGILEILFAIKDGSYEIDIRSDKPYGMPNE